MAMKTLDELFEHELKDIYYAEHRLVEALTQLAEETKNREIKRAYTSHKKETQGQIKRLQKVFRMFGAVPEVEKCPGIEGLLKEKQNFTRKEKPSQEILEYFNLGAASKTERYEITAYESLIEMAQQLGMDDAVELLSQTLQEEETALETMKALAQEFDVAALIPQEEEEESEESGGSRGGSKGSAKGAAKGSAKGSSKGSAKGASKSSSKGSAKGSTRGTASRGATGRNASTKGSAKGAASRGGSSKTASGATASGANTSARGSSKRTAGATAGGSSKGSRGAASRGESERGGMADTGGMSGRDGMGGAGADENIMGTTMPAGASGPAPTPNDYAGDTPGEMIQTDPATAI